MKQENHQVIRVTGARVHNLKNIDVEIPRDSLTVITGLSGSGKSSLAFDTIYAEGQRRYIETFSAYVRNFLGGFARPDVDKITGLSPVISIEQKTTNRNPRSTVGTVTEIYDYLRLLFARAAKAYSYNTGEEMVRYTDEQILNLLLSDYEGRRVYILAPMVRNRKGHYRELFDSAMKKGYLTVRVDGTMCDLEPDMKVDRYKNHSIEVVVDKLVCTAKDSDRLLHSVATAMKMGNGLVMLLAADDDTVRYYSRNLMCPSTGISYNDPAPHDFSFNSPQGACPECNGLGYVVEYKGSEEDMRRFMDDESISGKHWLEQFETHVECPMCHGARLRRESLHFRIADKNIHELSSMDIAELHAWLSNVSQCLDKKQRLIADEIIKEIRTRLQFLLDVGLDYLSLSRRSVTLSGGESQRIRLATQIGAKLVNVLYILDEPSIGLHQRDNERLINSLKTLRDMGNTVIVVEHDRDMMLAADYIVDMGPLAGRKGGQVMFQGTPGELMKTNTLTAQYLSAGCRVQGAGCRVQGAGLGVGIPQITLHGCRGNNLKNITVSFPLGRLICVTGVSGSGKSTLINDTLQPILSQHLYKSLTKPLDYDSIEGIDLINKVVTVDQSPIGRTPRSNPATYIDVFADIRKLFVSLPEAKIRGYKPGRFSFNVSGGRCETCGGNGYKTIEMKFLPDVLVPCESCHGMRYNRETLEVRFKGKSIADVLDMTFNMAVDFFENQPQILSKIKIMQEVGLGYLKLGQPSTTLSGGESQRVKLATELARRDTGKSLYILDEPTTGLHYEDIKNLMKVLRRLVDKGNTVIVIEHNTDVICQADYIIDMGPEGGRLGGEVVVTGTLEEVLHTKRGYTYKYLSQES